MNKKVLLTFLIFLLLVASCALGFFLGTEYANKENNTPKVEEKTEKEEEKEEVEEEPKVPQVENITFNKEKTNEALDTFMLAFQMTGLNDDDTIIGPSRRNQTELLDAKTKLKLAWYYVFKSGNSDKIKYDASPSGEEITGSAGVDLELYKSFYQSMYCEELPTNPDYTVLGYSKDSVKNNILYGTMASGVATIYTAFKANSITKTDDNYELIVDVIHEDVKEDDENPTIETYLENNQLSYPSNLVIYHLKITYKIENNKYLMKSIVAY